jgi:hypothetical protein
MSCGTEVPPASGFCGNCGARSVGNADAAARPAVSAEQVLFNQNGVFVSNSRYITAGQTYAMAGVTSVKMFVEQPSRTGPVITMILGGLLILGGLESLMHGNPLVLLVGVVLFALGLWIFKKRVPIYSVLLHSASGEQKVNQSTVRGFIEQIVAALNQAIVARG